ncbi:MAG TPA: hypothetical protein VFA63_12350 [Pseudonocardiaceae bacterium]|nr:hypothetical protein [Pseudonocardiaceae bacterium]
MPALRPRPGQSTAEWLSRISATTGHDTIANEPASGVALPLHCALMRNLGVAMTEIAWLDDLAAACAEDGRWSFPYAAAPLKVVSGTGAPVNPIAIR